MPNNCVQVTPDCAFLFALRHWPGAPDAERSEGVFPPDDSHAIPYSVQVSVLTIDTSGAGW
jgi:hypothetical protein